MKNQITYITFLLVLSSSFACVNQEDRIIESGPEVVVPEGETKIISGIVRDTSGTFLQEAGVKIILDDLELETETDENGTWSLIVPESFSEGYLVANKVEYSKSINRIDEIENNQVQDVFLADQQSNAELNLSFKLGNLRTVKGRLVDEDLKPESQVNLFIFGLREVPQNEFVFLATGRSKSDGSFELLYEIDNYETISLFGIISGGCRDVLEITLQGQDPIEDLGDVDVSHDEFAVMQTKLESDGSDCYGAVSTLSYYWDYTYQYNIKYDQPLGDVSVDYCPKGNSVFYLGVESDDDVYFNGLFVSETEVEDAYMLDICIPDSDSFLELNIDGNVTVYTENLALGPLGEVISNDAETPLVFAVPHLSSFTPFGSDKPAYQIGEIRSIQILGDYQVGFNKIDDNDPEFNYANIVQSDFNYFSGIVQTNIPADDGTELNVKIRFRIAR